MNELTRQIQGIMIPQAALIAYELQNEVCTKTSYYLELRPIDGKGRMRAAVPVTYEFMNALTESFSVEMNGIPHGRIPENLLWCDTRKGNERYIWYNPPARRRMFFHRQLNLAGGEFNLPGIIYEAGREKLDVFAFKGEKTEDETELYLAPYFNVTRTSVCLGSSRIVKPENPSFHELLEYWERLFWMSEFSHLGSNGNPTLSNLVLVTENARNKPFDLDELKPMNKKLKDILP